MYLPKEHLLTLKLEEKMLTNRDMYLHSKDLEIRSESRSLTCLRSNFSSVNFRMMKFSLLSEL